MKNIKKTSLRVIGIFVAITIILSVIGNYFLFSNWSNDELQSFSNMFAGINTLFSGLALAGIILTIILQNNELSLQREELVETRVELRRTAEAQEKAEIALNRQAENLKISAKLSAMNTLVNFYGEVEEANKKFLAFGEGHSDAKSKKSLYISKIEEILNKKELN